MPIGDILDEGANRTHMERVKGKIAGTRSEYGHLGDGIKGAYKPSLDKHRKEVERIRKGFKAMQKKVDAELKLLKTELVLLKRKK